MVPQHQSRPATRSEGDGGEDETQQADAEARMILSGAIHTVVPPICGAWFEFVYTMAPLPAAAASDHDSDVPHPHTHAHT